MTLENMQQPKIREIIYQKSCLTNSNIQISFILISIILRSYNFTNTSPI